MNLNKFLTKTNKIRQNVYMPSVYKQITVSYTATYTCISIIIFLHRYFSMEYNFAINFETKQIAFFPRYNRNMTKK